MDFPDPWEKTDLLGYPTKRAIAEEEKPLSCNECLKLFEKTPVCRFQERDCWAYSESLKQSIKSDTLRKNDK